jgi:hypothetical protein
MLGMLGVHSTFESELDDDEELEEGVTLLVFLTFCFLDVGINESKVEQPDGEEEEDLEIKDDEELVRFLIKNG